MKYQVLPSLKIKMKENIFKKCSAAVVIGALRRHILMNSEVKFYVHFQKKQQ